MKKLLLILSVLLLASCDEKREMNNIYPHNIIHYKNCTIEYIEISVNDYKKDVFITKCDNSKIINTNVQTNDHINDDYIP